MKYLLIYTLLLISVYLISCGPDQEVSEIKKKKVQVFHLVVSEEVKGSPILFFIDSTDTYHIVSLSLIEKLTYKGVVVLTDFAQGWGEWYLEPMEDLAGNIGNTIVNGTFEIIHSGAGKPGRIKIIKNYPLALNSNNAKR